MYTIDDYIIWRGDLSFKENPFNEIDNLILSNIAYVRFTDIIKDQALTLKEASDLFFKQDPSKQIVRDIKDLDFLKNASLTKRFGEIKLYNHQEVYDINTETQFGAITFDLLNDDYYIAFRGTDNYIAGWKEDFNLSYMVIPSQKLALEYLTNIIDSISGFKKKIYVGGHSKGGNLAMYASAHLKMKYFKKLTHIYNNDGPGFDFNLVDKTKFDKLLPILTTYTPKTSIVASFFSKVGEFTIIDSNEFSFLEHDPYSWIVEGTKFKYENKVADASLITKEKLDSWFLEFTYQERQNLASDIYNVILLSGARNLNEILPSLLKNHKKVQKYLKTLDEKTGKTIASVISLLFTSISSSVGDNFKNLFKKD